MQELIKKHGLSIRVDNWRDECEFSDLLNHEVVDVFKDECFFQILTKTHLFQMYHDQDCCEHVYLQDVVGDIQSLIGNKILMAEESYGDEKPLSEHEESFTWTFYKLATIKGYVDLRWYGSSNGYYSESVTCIKTALEK